MSQRLKLNISSDESHIHHHSHEEEIEDEVVDASPSIIFDSQFVDETIPTGFDAVKISIDGTVKADLSWKESRKIADHAVKNGYKIFWEMDLGLFDKLTRAIDHPSQFLSLTLSLEHFRDTLWKEYKEHSIGLCIYRGKANFNSVFHWDEKQELNFQAWLKEHFTTIDILNKETGFAFEGFSEITSDHFKVTLEGEKTLSYFCRDVYGEYLELLANFLPDNIPCYTLLDASQIADPLWAAQLLTKERFPRLHLCIKSNLIPFGELGWESSLLKLGYIGRQLPASDCSTLKTEIGVCLAPLNCYRYANDRELAQALDFLTKKQFVYRFIPECLLTTEWDGLDFLIVQSRNINHHGRRKLLGFCAAGGTVITIGEPLSLPLEVSFPDWIIEIDSKRI